MLRALRHWVDLRDEEIAPALQAMGTLFCVIGAHTMLETARDTLFLGKLPPNRLTWVYVIVAVLTLLVAKVNAEFVQRFGRRNALIFTLMGTAYGTTMLFLAPETPEMAFILYVWSGLVGTVMVVQFWMLAGQMFTVAQGKRLFGPLAAGGVLGAVLGASVAAIVLQFAQVRSLLLGSSLILIAAAAVLTGVPSDQTLPKLEARRARHERIKALTKDPYLVRLGALIATVTALALVTEYLFKSVSARSFAPADLGLFLARYYAVLNAASLLVQVFLAGYLVRRIGVVASLAIMPFAMLLGAVGVVASGGALLLVLLTRGADGALRHSLHRVSSELMWMPLPDETKSAAKSIADAILGRGVQAGMAGVLMVLATFGLDRPMILGAMILVLGGTAIALTVSLRRRYFDLFRRALGRDAAGVPEFELDLNSAEMVIDSLSSRDPDRVIAAIDLLVTQKRTRLIPSLILYHESEAVLIRALEVVTSPDRKEWVPLAERLLSHQNEGVRVAAVRALVAGDHHELVMSRLADISPAVRAHTAFCLVQHTKADPLGDPHLQDVLAISGEKREPARYALLDAICIRGDERWREVIYQIAQEASSALNEKLAEAMIQVRDPRFLPILVGRLGSREGRSTLRRAIVSYGKEALDALETLMKDPSVDPRLRLHAPRTISQFKEQRAAELLVTLLVSDTDGTVRFKALRGLGRMVEESPVRVDVAKLGASMKRNLVEHMRLLALWAPLSEVQSELSDDAKLSGQLLLDLLDDKLRQSTERVFRLLKIAHRSEDLRAVYDALRMGDRRMRANALEFLDALTLRYPSLGPDHSTTRELLRILADDLPARDRVVRARQFMSANVPDSAEEALSLLLREDDPALATFAAHHALKLGVVDLAREVASASEQRRLLEVREVARAV
jgi:ATP:ADP antiporter, AAA family